jgi:hypothetical protein
MQLPDEIINSIKKQNTIYADGMRDFRGYIIFTGK